MKKYLKLKEINKDKDYFFYQITHQEFRDEEFNPLGGASIFRASNGVELCSITSPRYFYKGSVLCCWGSSPEKDKNLIKIPRGQVKVVLQAVEEYNTKLNEYLTGDNHKEEMIWGYQIKDSYGDKHYVKGNSHEYHEDRLVIYNQDNVDIASFKGADFVRETVVVS